MLNDIEPNCKTIYKINNTQNYVCKGLMTMVTMLDLTMMMSNSNLGVRNVNQSLMGLWVTSKVMKLS